MEEMLWANVWPNYAGTTQVERVVCCPQPFHRMLHGNAAKAGTKMHRHMVNARNLAKNANKEGVAGSDGG